MLYENHKKVMPRDQRVNPTGSGSSHAESDPTLADYIFKLSL